MNFLWIIAGLVVLGYLWDKGDRDDEALHKTWVEGLDRITRKHR
jgi:hypothetical protein